MRSAGPRGRTCACGSLRAGAAAASTSTRLAVGPPPLEGSDNLLLRLSVLSPPNKAAAQASPEPLGTPRARRRGAAQVAN